MSTKYARLKPYDPKRGHVMRKYTHGPTGKKFEEKAGWAIVDDALAKQLEKIHQQDRDPYSPLAFDVTDKEGARKIDLAEKRQHERASAETPADMTTDDLRHKAPSLERKKREKPEPRRSSMT